jgi:small subunit ribosomal protein S16
MLKIRLARVGKKKKPTYRFIVSEAGRDTFGQALEILGHYNPLAKVCEVKKDRLLYWLDKGAKASPTVHNLLVDQNVINLPKVKAAKSGKQKKAGASALAESMAAKDNYLKPVAKPAKSDSVTSPITTNEVQPQESSPQTNTPEIPPAVIS